MIKAQLGVVVGLPCSRNVMPEWAVALASQNWPTNTNVCYVPVRSTPEQPIPIDAAREYIAEGALKLGAPYIWFLDDDVEVPYMACRQLMATLKQAADDVMIVGGIYPARQYPTEPIVYRGTGAGPFWRWKKNTIFECDLIGTGCMLIKTEVFKHLEKPWFKTIDTDNAKITDDAWFCDKVREKGFKILADAHVICKHWDNQAQKAFELPKDSYPFQDVDTTDISSYVEIPHDEAYQAVS